MHPYSEEWAHAGTSNDIILLNDYHSGHLRATTQGTLVSFSQFPLLPAELRLSIWKFTLQEHRLIPVAVIDGDDKESSEEQQRVKNNLGNEISGENYTFQINSLDFTPTPLLQANRESRQAALEFYRVHVPYDRFSSEKRFYFSPEFDFIYAYARHRSELLVHFIHDFKAYDPRGVGILNLGFHISPSRDLAYNIEPSVLRPTVLSSFKTTLSNLRCVFFSKIVYVGARTMYGYDRRRIVHYNRSYPITAAAHAFNLIGADPRPIEPDLDKVSIDRDPRSMPYEWQQMERRFGITRKEPQTTEFVYHFSAGIWGPKTAFHASSRSDAISTIQRERDEWNSRFGARDTPESLKSAPIPAFGFWVFPLDTFGEIPDGYCDPDMWERNMIVSLKKHRPQLGVYRLPG